MMAIRRTLSVFHWRVSYNPHTCRSNVSVRKTTVIITELSPKFAPTNETLLFLLLLNSVQHPPWVRGKLLSISNVLANWNYTMQNCLARNANSFLSVSRAVPLSEVGAPQQKASGWVVGHGTTWFFQLPNQIKSVGYNTLSVALNWAQHACPQNVQVTAQEMSVLCLNPALHKKFQFLTLSN